MATLSARAGQALRWGTLTLLARIGLQLVAQVLLARLLGPDAYGVYALGLALLTFAGFLAGNGFAYGLLLRPQIDDDDICLAFTWQVSAGLACAAAMVVGAPALAAFFRAPDLAPTLRWMAIACLCSACAGTALALMQRALDQRRQGLQHAAPPARQRGRSIDLHRLLRHTQVQGRVGCKLGQRAGAEAIQRAGCG